MPIRKVRGGFKITNVAGIHQTRHSAKRQLAAIKANQSKQKKVRKK